MVEGEREREKERERGRELVRLCTMHLSPNDHPRDEEPYKIRSGNTTSETQKMKQVKHI